MHAAFVHAFGGPETLSLETAPDPAPGDGEVVVDIAATAANFVDLLVIGGKYQFLPPIPFVPGKLPAGTVSAVGPGVAGLAVGDRVQTLAEQGGYATRVAVPAKDCIRLPERMSFVEAAAMALAYDTAWFALMERARAKAGETLLVLGATGGVGMAAVQLGKAYGLRVLAGVSSPAKAGLATDAGADGIVDLSAADLREGLRRQVYDQNGGKGADVVLDPLGGDFFDAAVRAVAWRGRLVVIGFAAGRIPTLKMNYVLLKNMEVSGLQVSDYRKRTPDLMRHCYDEIFRLYEEGKLHAPPTTTFPLDRVADALVTLRDRKAAGRIVLLPAGEASSRIA
ncbi:NADPH:quinone oxidoreductase family protein [Propylenella binzhouense]|uniref:NADPH:quinone oxidoreductase family protein n=1 Tax=Propylenella binzhouense TaxID=2555902 RepID=A0A964WUU2_9HYPH|nr:NADPH:quinone oxidoreductase family protein [Propylenella binzhouense]MYZ49190.1 NADPH:quinone oxidoreductase family protein [Propylenella binzhouense]